MLLHTFSSSFTVPALLEHELGIGNTIHSAHLSQASTGTFRITFYSPSGSPGTLVLGSEFHPLAAMEPPLRVSNETEVGKMAKKLRFLTKKS